MKDEQHFVQDACEILAVAELQRLAEKAGLAATRNASEKLQHFENYSAERKLTEESFSKWPKYRGNLDRHLPGFFEDLIGVIGDTPMDFVDVERDFRNLNLKGDFVIMRDRHDDISVSLKNYQGSAKRPQCSSSTFNAFPLNFIFESAGVGMFLGPDGVRFRGSAQRKRDAALRATGHEDVVPLMVKLDELNAAIKDRFVYDPDFEFLDEDEFDKARKEVGASGQAIILEILHRLDPATVKDRLLEMTGLDGREEVLLLDPYRRSDTITNEGFCQLRFGVSDPASTVEFGAHGQSIRFEFILGSRSLLTVDVPFTINKNGAWISDEYEGTRFHEKEGLELATGQRRPMKSKQLATSTNTYVDFDAAGIF